jgi:hypothetical protein
VGREPDQFVFRRVYRSSSISKSRRTRRNTTVLEAEEAI